MADEEAGARGADYDEGYNDGYADASNAGSRIKKAVMACLQNAGLLPVDYLEDGVSVDEIIAGLTALEPIPAQGEAVAWQQRDCVLRSNGKWSEWMMTSKNAHDQILDKRPEGYEARALYPAPTHPEPVGELERLIKRLENPPFGTETSERNLMTEAAAALRAATPVGTAMVTEAMADAMLAYLQTPAARLLTNTQAFKRGIEIALAAQDKSNAGGGV